IIKSEAVADNFNRILKLIIMSWIERPERKSQNPAKKFLEWKSDKKCFVYYDKEAKENVEVALPFNFVILEHYHTVKGWHDKSESGIYSNEVFAIGSDEVEVKAFKGGLIAKGLYKEIKGQIKDAGAHYSRSIYAVTKDLEIVNIQLKGSGVSAYSDFINDFGDNNFDKHWVKISEAKELKKGKVNYSIPVFEKGQAIKDKSKLKPFAEELGEYMAEYLHGTPPNRDNSAVDKYEAEKDDDDLAF
ncbi:MAG: hypothetical protein WDZ41_00170, partial [Candidatus Babeliales bacterium]